MPVALQSLLLLTVQFVGVRIKPYESDLSCTVATLHDFCKNVKHAPSVAAYGVMAMLIFVALHDVCAPGAINGEIHAGQATLCLATEVDYNFALVRHARVCEEAGHALLLFLLPLLTASGVVAALVLGQVRMLLEARTTTLIITSIRLLTSVVARMYNQCALLCEACTTPFPITSIWLVARVRAFVRDQRCDLGKARAATWVIAGIGFFA
jgi:hypothetical protein